MEKNKIKAEKQKKVCFNFFSFFFSFIFLFSSLIGKERRKKILFSLFFCCFLCSYTKDNSFFFNPKDDGSFQPSSPFPPFQKINNRKMGKEKKEKQGRLPKINSQKERTKKINRKKERGRRGGWGLIMFFTRFFFLSFFFTVVSTEV